MRLKVLVVEDDPIQADDLARQLWGRGYYADVVNDGREALRRIRTGIFDVAVIDYRLPEVDGLGIARVIRSLNEASCQPRLVALTAAPHTLTGYSEDFDEILSKPADLDRLLQAIERGRRPSPAIDEAAPVAQPKPAAIASSKGEAGARGSVLLADDDPPLRAFLQQALQYHGYKVDLAADGLEAVERIGGNAYDVVLVDFKMPRLDGLSAAKVIYDLVERQARPRIVALTSTPGSLVARDPEWPLVLDEIVSKADGVPAVLAAVENCIGYKELRSQTPLEILDLRSLTTLAHCTAVPAPSPD